ncbi:hypothetical protein OSG_eHP1_00125 [environmental Halophage eHP-1]|nr:hypothetical protein OSG_eHP1_00125 [environmental Halophage eHP-1]
MPPSDQEPRYRLVDSNDNVVGSLFGDGNGNVEIQDETGTSYLFTSSPNSGSDVARFQDLPSDTRTDISDGGTTVVSDTSDINFVDNLTVTDDGDGTVRIDAATGGTDTRTDVSDDGTLVVTDTEDINFGSGLDVTDDGDTSVTVDSTASGTGGTADTASVTGDGSTTVFTLPHSHGQVPEAAQIQPESTTAADANFWVADKRDTEIDVEYKSAPASNTLVFNLWLAGGGDAIPDSAVLYATASDYDGSKFVSQVGPDIPDVAGDPTVKTKTYRGNSINVVEFQRSSSDFAQTTNLSLTDSKQAVIYVMAERDVGTNSQSRRFIDGGAADEFTIFNNNNGGEYRILSGDIDVSGAGTPDENLHVFVNERDGSTYRLYVDGTSSPVLSGTGSPDDLTGLSLNDRADQLGALGKTDWKVIEVFEGHTDTELSDEVSRLKSEYNIP